MSASGTPMFPAGTAGTPAAFSRWQTSSVVVVLPLVPVIAMQRRRGRLRKPNSSSLMNSASPRSARRAAACQSGEVSGGTPGLVTMREHFSTASSGGTGAGSERISAFIPRSSARRRAARPETPSPRIRHCFIMVYPADFIRLISEGAKSPGFPYNILDI